MKSAFFLLALSSCACAQTRDPVSDGMMQGVLIANQIREAQRRQAETERLRAETNAIREQTAVLREQRRHEEAASATPPPRMVTNEEWGAAVKRVTALHSDFNDYRPAMLTLLAAFPAGNVALPDYLEGLYLIAKYASFAPPITPPAAPAK